MFYLIAIIILSLHNRLIYGITCKGEYDEIMHKEVSNYDYGSIPGAYIIKKSIPIERRKNVDFFVGILPPADKLEKGKDKDSSWNWSNRALADSESIIGKTFEKVYSDPEQYNFIQYSTSKGSGALVWSESNKENAVWFIHSSRYLNSFSKKTYKPSTSNSKKASNFMCLSIRLKNVQKVYDRLMAAGVKLYDQRIKPGKSKVIIQKRSEINDMNSNTNTEQINDQNRAVMSKLLENDRSKLFILSTVFKEPIIIVTKSILDRSLFWMTVSRRIGVRELYVKSNLIPPNYTTISKRICKDKISDVLETIFTEKNGHSLNWKIEPELDQSNWGICGNKMDCYCTSDINNTIAGSINTNGIAVCIFNSNLHKAFKDSIRRSAC